ncbi:MAG: triphosphoribosyl-dephospho-CoA synthase [Pirellulales bacterium]|nr:triphosphoribosyl-dephospho-CoA synthase [Pirellulales bacterium]
MSNHASPQRLTLGQTATLAILREATAPKPGNVYRGADFEDMTYDDIVAGGIAIAPAIDQVPHAPLGQVVYDAVQRTQCLVGKNTNLGTILLIGPLAKAAASMPALFGSDVAAAWEGTTHAALAERFEQLAPQWRSAVARNLQSLTPDDTRLVYAAISAAKPGGLGTVEEHDVAKTPLVGLVEAMRAASNRDLVAAQYANAFEQVFDVVLERLVKALGECPRDDAIVRVYLQLMAEYPDSLIARKCGPEVSRQSAERAASVLEAAKLGEESYAKALAEFDFWLRSDGHRRNPGTSADLIAAGLFCVILLGSSFARNS